MKQSKRILSICLTLTMLMGLCATASAAVDDKALEAAIQDTGAYLYQTVQDPQVGSVGGEWAVLGLARSGYAVPEEYYQRYYATVEAYVRACDGKLHNKKYTEYARLIVALSSMGKDARAVAGYDLTRALGDYDKTIWQGLNGPIWALIALDTGDYPMPQNPEAKTQATRQMYVDRILACQLPDGGWSLFGGTGAAASGDGVSDPDITGMALQALAKYQSQSAVAKATGEALECMSKQQDKNGGYSSWGTANSESCVQMMVALCELGVPLDDPRFVKSDKTLLDNLMQFYVKGNGFTHALPASGSDQMATEQAFYGLVAARRAAQGESSLYRMGDALTVPEGLAGPKPGEGLEGRDAAVTKRPIVAPGKTFPDITGVYAHKNQPAIEALAARGIISGKDGGHFDPDGSMTRAEFATIVVKALGLAAKPNLPEFPDVPGDAWYRGDVALAAHYGIVSGSGGTFNPTGTITRQEAAKMVTNAAKLCGMDTAVEGGAVRDVLAQFTDYVSTPQWAREALAFCYGEDILDQSALEIRPTEAVKRCEVAQMLFHLLGSANLL